MHILFHSKTAGNHSTYIRIKIDEPTEDLDKTTEKVLVVPVEIEVLNEYSIYAKNPLIDFGVLAAGDSSGNKRAIVLQHKVDFFYSETNEIVRPLVVTGDLVPFGIKYDVQQSAITLNPSILAQSEHLNSGHHLLTLNVSAQLNSVTSPVYYKVYLLLRYDLYKGLLHYDPEVTLFTPKDKCSHQRTLTITNYFQLPLLIFNISIIDPSYNRNIFSVQPRQIYSGIILGSFESLDAMNFSLISTDVQGVNYKTIVAIHTNLTIFEIPLIVTSGRLNVFIQTDSLWNSSNSIYSTELNLGKRLHTTYVILQNLNPFEVKIRNWNMNSPAMVRCSIVYLGCIRAKTSNYIQNAAVVNLKKSNYSISYLMEENDLAVFSIDVNLHSSAINKLDNFIITQSMTIATVFENITVSLKLLLPDGRLSVDQENIRFDNCFPVKYSDNAYK